MQWPCQRVEHQDCVRAHLLRHALGIELGQSPNPELFCQSPCSLCFRSYLTFSGEGPDGFGIQRPPSNSKHEGCRWPPSFEPLPVVEFRGWKASVSIRLGFIGVYCVPQEALSSLKDTALTVLFMGRFGCNHWEPLGPLPCRKLGSQTQPFRPGLSTNAGQTAT